jgi:DNA-directed RNA polymerase subunit RPC12/RpoP
VAPDTGDGPGADTGGYTVSGGAGATWQAGEQENMLVYSCNSCGGQIVTDLTTAATHCPYCGNPVIMTGQLSGALRPDWVIPFSRTKEDALAALNKHYRGKPLLPRVFKDENHIEEVKGLYVPFWLFGYDAAGDVHWHATRVTYGSDSKYNYTYTSHYAIWRAGQATLDNVPVDGSSKMPDALMESIEPFDYSQAVDFGTAYLSGFFADKYDVDDAKSAPRAATRARNTLESMLGETAGGYTTMAKESAAIDLDQTGCRYALLPVWVLSTKWRDKYYLFAMNGQTGKLVGNLPVSPLAFFLYFAGIMGGITAVVFALVWFLA